MEKDTVSKLQIADLTFDVTTVKNQLSHRQMIILAKVFLNWSEEQTYAEKKPMLVQWSNDLVALASEVGRGWQPPEPEKITVMGYLARHCEKGVDKRLADQNTRRKWVFDFKQAIPELAVIVLLLWALLPLNPYGFYMFLRLVVCGFAAHFTYRAKMAGQVVWMCIFAGMAVLYNPFIRMHLDRESWSWINVATIVIISWYSWVQQRDKKSL